MDYHTGMYPQPTVGFQQVFVEVCLSAEEATKKYQRIQRGNFNKNF